MRPARSVPKALLFVLYHHANLGRRWRSAINGAEVNNVPNVTRGHSCASLNMALACWNARTTRALVPQPPLSQYMHLRAQVLKKPHTGMSSTNDCSFESRMLGLCYSLPPKRNTPTQTIPRSAIKNTPRGSRNIPQCSVSMPTTAG